MKKELDSYTQIHTVMGAVRQLIKGSTSDKLAFLQRTLPQRIEDGEFINYMGESIGKTDLDDQELVKVERLLEASQITDKLLTDIFHPLNTRIFIDLDKEVDGEPRNSKKAKKKSKKNNVDALGEPEPSNDELSRQADITALKKYIKKGSAKKASKLLKSLKDTLNKKAFKQYKKQVKGL